MADHSRLQELSAAGVSVWIDSLSREMLDSGQLAALMADDSVVGVTSNPTIFQKALAEGDLYDEQLREVAGDDRRHGRDLLRARDGRHPRGVRPMRPVWERTAGIDGFVSLEVDPTLAYEREQTFEQALRFSKEVDRANLYVKIPATEPGLGAIEDCIAKGVPINVTLIFSLERYAAVAEAYLRGLERLVAGGGDASKVLSVASFFVSRVDTEADKRLEALGRTDLQGKLAVANAKLAYQHYLDVFGDDRWAYLAGKGARPQRCLWASTSAKNPAYRDVIYVEELIGPDTVNTMPLETVRAFQDHGEVKPTASPRGSTRRTRCWQTSPPPASTTTTSSRRSRPRACRSSPTRSPSCSTASAPRWARWRPHERGRGQPAARGPAAAAAPRGVRRRDLRRLG